MRTTLLTISSIFFLCASYSIAIAQPSNITETFNKQFNETFQQVQQTNNADEKRELLNESFTQMITTVNRVQSLSTLKEKDSVQLNAFKNDLQQKQNELNGLDGSDKVSDEDLDEFSSSSQDLIQNANRTVTIGLGTALLIILILILL